MTSCGQVDKVLPTSISDAAIREDTCVASVIRRAYGSLSSLVRLASRAESTSPSRPCMIGRDGSMSNLSTSSRPRSLVAISTGRRRVLATSRISTFASSESHSSMTMSRPSRKSPTVCGGDASRHDRHRKVWVELGDPPGTHHCLVHTKVEDRCGHSIQIRQLQVIEVGKPQLTAQALCRKGVGNRMSHAEADDADAKPAEAFELGGGDQVSISVKSEQPKCARTQNTDHRPAPGIVNPPDGLGAHIVAAEAVEAAAVRPAVGAHCR